MFSVLLVVRFLVNETSMAIYHSKDLSKELSLARSSTLSKAEQSLLVIKIDRICNFRFIICHYLSFLWICNGMYVQRVEQQMAVSSLPAIRSKE